MDWVTTDGCNFHAMFDAELKRLRGAGGGPDWSLTFTGERAKASGRALFNGEWTGPTTDVHEASPGAFWRFDGCTASLAGCPNAAPDTFGWHTPDGGVVTWRRATQQDYEARQTYTSPLRGFWASGDAIWTLEASGRALFNGQWVGPECDVHEDKEGGFWRKDGCTTTLLRRRDHQQLDEVIWNTPDGRTVTWTRRAKEEAQAHQERVLHAQQSVMQAQGWQVAHAAQVQAHYQYVGAMQALAAKSAGKWGSVECLSATASGSARSDGDLLGLSGSDSSDDELHEAKTAALGLVGDLFED